jgi:hypothetical protein
MPFEQVKFVNEPAKTASTNSSSRPGTTGGSTATTASSSSTSSNNGKKWYPDHAVVNASKDQLKSMQQFKYN